MDVEARPELRDPLSSKYGAMYMLEDARRCQKRGVFAFWGLADTHPEPRTGVASRRSAGRPRLCSTLRPPRTLLGARSGPGQA